MKRSSKLFLLLLFVILLVFVYITYSKETNIIEPNNYELDGITIKYFDVGQADAILIQDKDNNILVDAGNTNDGPLLVDYFKSIGISRFSYVFGTHAHEDHIGGMADIIDNFDIDNFYMPNVMTTTKCFEDILDSLLNKEIRFQTPDNDYEFDVDDMHIKILYVGNDEKNLNNSSIVFKLVYKNEEFLFTGDATTKVEKEIINKDIKADVLKVGHHGSKTSSSNSFINKVNPMYAIISVGKNNKYNLPSQSILDRLNSKNINIFQTSEDGTIIVKSNGNDIDIIKDSLCLDGD